MRVLAFDISLSSPGAAVLEMDKKGAVKVIAVSHTKTSDKEPYAVRGAQIEHWAHLFAREHKKRGYDVIGREAYAGKFGNHSIFSAWAAVDRGLHYLLLENSHKPIPQSTVKLLVVGKGIATKDEVEEAVRRITGYEGEFKTDDESDVVAIGLAILMQLGHIPITPALPKAPKKKKESGAK